MHSLQIFDYLTTALQQIQREEFLEALHWLDISEQMLEVNAQRGRDIDYNLILVILHNKALCYQKNAQLLEACDYLEACCFNAQTKPVFSAKKSRNESLEAEEIRKLRYQSRMRFLQAVIYSTQAKHLQSYEQAMLSIQSGVSAISHCYNICKQQTKLFKQGRFTFNTTQPHKLVGQCIYQLPYLNGVFSYLTRRITRFPYRYEVKSSLGDDSDLTLLSAEELMQVPRLRYSDANCSYGLIDEISSDLLYENVSVLALSYSLAANQLKHMKKLGDKSIHMKDIKRLYEDAFIISRDFLHIKSPILAYISKGSAISIQIKRSGSTIKRSASLKPIRPNFHTELLLTQTYKDKSLLRSTSSRKRLSTIKRSTSAVKISRRQTGYTETSIRRNLGF